MLVSDPAVPGGERTKLLDFGIAKLKLELQGSGDQVMTRAGVMMGTPLYMAPEQCRNASDVDDKADVYSLGVMLYRMLAGKPPFSAAGTGELMAMHIYMQPPPLSEADRSLPEPLVQLVHSMLAKKREERPSMSQVAQELERIAVKASGMMQALPPSPSAPVLPSPARQGVSINEGATVLSSSSKMLAPPLEPRPRSPIALGAGAGIVLLLAVGGGLLAYRQMSQVPAGPPVPPAKPSAAENAPAKPLDAPNPPSKQKAVNWHIESDPSGAEIYQLDTNEQLGTTPFRSSQPPKPGMIALELRLKGYQPAKLLLDGSTDAEPPPVKLDPEKSGRKRDKKKDRTGSKP